MEAEVSVAQMEVEVPVTQMEAEAINNDNLPIVDEPQEMRKKKVLPWEILDQLPQL
jgi:hypothetical protein